MTLNEYVARRRPAPFLVATPHPGHPLIAKKLWKVPVRVRANDSRLCATIKTVYITVIAKDPKDAANWVRDTIGFLPEVEITAFGPKGGRTERYIGYQSAIMHQMAFHPSDEDMKEAVALIFGDL